MDEKTKSPVALMADLLATMTERAMAAERQRDEARKNADDWHTYYVRKAEQLEEAEAKLAAEIEEHQITRKVLRDMLDNTQKGAGENGESNHAGEDDCSQR